MRQPSPLPAGASCADFARPEGNRMLATFGKGDVLAVTKLDRASVLPTTR